MEVVDPRAPIASRMDGWPECFQDLRSWCHTDQDELNTPQITMQDEFNFSVDGQVNSGNWGLAHPPVEINDSWVNQQDLLLASSNNVMITDEENNNFDFQSNFSTSYIKGDSLNNLVMQSKVPENTSIANSNNSILKTKGNVLLSQVSILPEDAPVVQDNGGSYTDLIKLNSSTSARLGSGGRLIKEEPLPVAPLQTTGSRPKLGLKIPQPQGQVACDLATPEVLKPFADLATSDFDLLNYVCGDSENGNRATIMAVPKKEELGDVTIQDHDYIEGRNSIVEDKVYIKCEPVSPSAMGISNRRTSSLNMSMDQDEEIMDSFDEDDDDEESEEWFPSSGKSRKGGPGRRRGRKASSLDSSDGGGGGMHDRYRALRDRNNEASRRSRLNRKERDLEMRRHKAELEKKNVELKVKADRMEALVKDMRAILLRTVRSRNQSQPAH